MNVSYLILASMDIFYGKIPHVWIVFAWYLPFSTVGLPESSVLLGCADNRSRMLWPWQGSDGAAIPGVRAQDIEGLKVYSDQYKVGPPNEIAKLVNITPITIAYDTITTVYC